MSKGSRKGRRASWGSITEIERGKRYRIRYWAETDSGYRRSSKTIRGTKREAEEERARLLLEHGRDKPCPTVGQAWEDYALPYYERVVESGDYARSTLDSHRSRWSVHIGPRWADVPCDAVTALDMQKWFDGLDYRTAVDCNKILRRVYKLVTKYHPEVGNVMLSGYDMPSRRRVAEQDKEAWTPSELKEIWDACRGTWLEAAVILRGYGGLRPGESLAVRGSDVVVREHGGVTVCVVTVDDQVLAHGYGLTDRTKNDQSSRFAFVAGKPGERLAELAKQVGDGYLTNDGFGNWVKQQRVYKNLDRVIMGAGIVRHPHKNMRKTWETAVRWHMGLPPWLSEPLMGHKLPGVTAQYYDRPSLEMMADVYADGYLRYPFGDS